VPRAQQIPRLLVASPKVQRPPFLPLKLFLFGRRDAGLIRPEALTWGASRSDIRLETDSSGDHTFIKAEPLDTRHWMDGMWNETALNNRTQKRVRRLQSQLQEEPGAPAGNDTQAFVGAETLLLRFAEEEGLGIEGVPLLGNLALSRMEQRVFMSNSCRIHYVNLLDPEMKDFVLQVLIPDRRSVFVGSFPRTYDKHAVENTYYEALQHVELHEGERSYHDRVRGLLGADKSLEKTQQLLQGMHKGELDAGLSMMMQFVRRTDSHGLVTKYALNLFRNMALGTYNVVFGWEWFMLREWRPEYDRE
jgi:hypothetical protein